MNEDYFKDFDELTSKLNIVADKIRTHANRLLKLFQRTSTTEMALIAMIDRFPPEVAPEWRKLVINVIEERKQYLCEIQEANNELRGDYQEIIDYSEEFLRNH